MKTKTLPVLTFAIILFTLLQASAQAPDSRYDTLYSSILKEHRPIRIILPQGYKQDKEGGYDILYVLDGELNTSLIEKNCEFLWFDKYIPPNIIIVSIPNVYSGGVNQCDRDFTPTRADDRPISGGAANFLAFLKEELVPYINKTYPAKPGNNTLYGNGLGGLFALYAFLYAPELFRSYVAVGPAVWWDKHYLAKIARSKPADTMHLDNTLWIAIVHKDPLYKTDGIWELDSILLQRKLKGLDYETLGVPLEGPFDAIFQGTHEGLRFSYRGIMREGDFVIVPSNGRVLKGKPFPFRVCNVTAGWFMHYTTDGSEPTAASPRVWFEQTFDFSNSTTVTVKALNSRKEHDKTIYCDFKVAPPLAAIQDPGKVKQGGLAYRYFKGDWEQLPDLENMVPDRTGLTANDTTINKPEPGQGSACLLEGLLKVPAEGYYVFETQEKSHVKVWINDQPILDGQTGGVLPSFIIYLQKGFYHFKEAYLCKKGDRSVPGVHWSPGDQSYLRPIAAEYLYTIGR